MRNENISVTGKHILVKEETKDRIGKYIMKGETWDSGISVMLDFLDKEENHDEFMLFKVMKRQNDNSKH